MFAIVRGAGWVAALMLWISPAGAQRAQIGTANDDAAAPSMRESVYGPLSEAQACASADDFACARRHLESVAARDDLTGYERAVAAQFSAFVHFEQGDRRAALEDYETVLAQPDVPAALRQDALFTASQLYAGAGTHERALETLGEWFEHAEAPSHEAYVLRAQLQYQLERWAEGKASIDEALRLAADAGRPLDEGSHQLAAVLDYELGGCERAYDVFETLMRRWPSRTHYLQAAACAGASGDPARRLELMDVAAALGLLAAGDSFNHALLLMNAERFADAERAIVRGNRLLDGAAAPEARERFGDAAALIDAERYDETMLALTQGLEGLHAARDERTESP